VLTLAGSQDYVRFVPITLGPMRRPQRDDVDDTLQMVNVIDAKADKCVGLACHGE
jgi:hypothetical protein